MSRWKFRPTEAADDSFCRLHLGLPLRGAQCGTNDKRTTIAFRSVILCTTNFVAFCTVAYFCWGSDTVSAQQLDFSVYARAVEYCRGDVPRPMTLNLDKRVLCFDGAIWQGQDISLAKGLEANGLFVVRSRGGDVARTVALADLLKDRRATVVVYDYCLLACASYLLFASEETFVLKNSLVAWRYSIDPLWCPSLVMANDGCPKRLEIAPCSGAPPEYQDGYNRFRDISREFYEARGADPLVEWPPQSAFVRKILRGRFEGTGTVPNSYWTWNPKHSAGAKTKIVYEAYPQTQSEVDAIAAQIPLYYPVVYDP
jgi:hypothetical protein